MFYDPLINSNRINDFIAATTKELFDFLRKMGNIAPYSSKPFVFQDAPVVELVDAPDSKSGSFGSAGSSPAGGTNFFLILSI